MTQERIEDYIDSLLQSIYISGNESKSETKTRRVLWNLAQAYDYISRVFSYSPDNYPDISRINRIIRGERNLTEADIGYRISDVYVNRQSSKGLLEKKLAPRPSSIRSNLNKVRNLLSDDGSGLERWKFPAIVFGSIFHIQPYNDGNKRTGLVMGNYYSFRNSTPLLSLPSLEDTNRALVKVEDNIMQSDISDPSAYEPLFLFIRR